MDTATTTTTTTTRSGHPRAYRLRHPLLPPAAGAGALGRPHGPLPLPRQELPRRQPDGASVRPMQCPRPSRTPFPLPFYCLLACLPNADRHSITAYSTPPPVHQHPPLTSSGSAPSSSSRTRRCAPRPPGPAGCPTRSVDPSVQPHACQPARQAGSQAGSRSPRSTGSPNNQITSFIQHRCQRPSPSCSSLAWAGCGRLSPLPSASSSPC